MRAGVLGVFLLVWIIIAILSMAMVIIRNEEKVVGEQPCVDGNHNINLAGIMCERIEYTWFGLNEYYSFLMILPTLIGGIIGIIIETSTEKIT